MTVEVRSPFAGRVVETFSAEGDEINVGEPLFVIIPIGDDDVAIVAPVAATPAATATAAATTVPVKAAVVHASAPAPVHAPTHAKAAPPAQAPPKAAAAPVKAAAAAPIGVLGARTETRVKMTRMRLRIAQRLKEAQNTAAMLTTFQVRHSILIHFQTEFSFIFFYHPSLLLPPLLCCIALQYVTPQIIPHCTIS